MAISTAFNLLLLVSAASVMIYIVLNQWVGQFGCTAYIMSRSHVDYYAMLRETGVDLG